VVEPVKITVPEPMPAPARAARPAAVTAKTASPPSMEEGPGLDAEALAKELAEVSSSVRFEVDHRSGDVVINVLDPQTEEVVRQIPPKELLEIRRRLDAYLGMLADEIA